MVRNQSKIPQFSKGYKIFLTCLLVGSILGHSYFYTARFDHWVDADAVDVCPWENACKQGSSSRLFLQTPSGLSRLEKIENLFLTANKSLKKSIWKWKNITPKLNRSINYNTTCFPILDTCHSLVVIILSLSLCHIEVSFLLSRKTNVVNVITVSNFIPRCTSVLLIHLLYSTH